MNPLFEPIVQFVEVTRPYRVLLVGPAEPGVGAAVEDARKRGWLGAVWQVDLGGEPAPSALRQAVDRIRGGQADLAIYAGPLDGPAVDALTGDRRSAASYATVCVGGGFDKPTILTDPLVHAQPGLRDKVTILDHAVRLARALGVERPNVAALTPLEFVNPAIPSTLDAACLAKMSERGQLGTAVVEGPLAMDAAASAEAARQKGIQSPVPGRVDIYLFPDREAAYCVTEFLCCLGGVSAAGILLGTPIPVVVGTPLDADAWLAKLALTLLQLKKA